MELLGETILAKCADFTKVKLLYVESLLKNCKITEAISFLKNKVTDDEKIKNEEFIHQNALALYQDGK